MPNKKVIFDISSELTVSHLGGSVIVLSVDSTQYGDVPLVGEIPLNYDDTIYLIDWLKELAEKIKN